MNACKKSHLNPLRTLLLTLTMLLLSCLNVSAAVELGAPASGNYYIVKSKKNPNMVWDIHDFSMENGGNLEICKYNGGTNQIFYIKRYSGTCYTIQALHSQKYLHKASSGTINDAHQWSGYGANNTLWEFIPAGGGYYYVRSRSRNYLQVRNGQMYSGNNILLHALEGTNSYKWKFVKTSPPKLQVNFSNIKAPSGTYTNYESCKLSGKITSNYPVSKMRLYVYNSNNKTVLSDISYPDRASFTFDHEFSFADLPSGTYYYRIRVWDVFLNSSYSKTYSFKVKKQSFIYSNIPNGAYQIASAVDRNMVIDVEGDGTTDGTNIIIYRNHSGDNQKFYIEKQNSGYYQIIDLNSGKALDVAGAIKGSNVNVQLYTWNGSDAQLWKFVSAGNGYYYIQNKLGYFLDLQGGIAQNTKNIWVYNKHTAKSERWYLTKTSCGSKLKIEGNTAPGTITKGSGFDIYGVVRSNYRLTNVTVGIYYANGTAYSEASVNPNHFEYDVNNLNYSFYVPNSTGTFYYKVKASDKISGERVLQNSQFQIVDSSISYAPYTGVDYTRLTSNSRRLAALKKAENMVQIRWTAPCDFVTWQFYSSDYGRYLYNTVTSEDGYSSQYFVKGKVYTGIPYSMHDRTWDDTIFANKLRSNSLTTQNMKAYYGGRPATTAHGIDCSYFVYVAVKAGNPSYYVRSDLTTYNIPSCGAFTRLNNFSELRPGDILNTIDHVRMFVGKVGDYYACFEAAAGPSRCVYRLYTASQLSGYAPYKFNGYGD